MYHIQSMRTRGVMSSQKPQTALFTYTTNEFLVLYSNYLIIIHRNNMPLFIRCHDHVFLLRAPKTHRPCEASPFGFGHIWRGPWDDSNQLVVLMRIGGFKQHLIQHTPYSTLWRESPPSFFVERHPLFFLGQFGKGSYGGFCHRYGGVDKRHWSRNEAHRFAKSDSGKICTDPWTVWFLYG